MDWFLYMDFRHESIKRLQLHSSLEGFLLLDDQK